MKLNEQRMSEAEVSIRLAMHLLDKCIAKSDVYIALDGAQIKTGTTIHFPITEFLATNGFRKKTNEDSWRGKYAYREHEHAIVIHSSPGNGDVVTTLSNDRRLIVESKKGELVKSKSSSEYRLIREALGQLVSIQEYDSGTILAVSVPDSEKSRELAKRWSTAPILSMNNIGFYLVSRTGEIKEVFSNPV